MSLPMHVEVVQSKHSSASVDFIKSTVHSYLSSYLILTPGTKITEFKDHSDMGKHVVSLYLCDVEHKKPVQMVNVDVIYHVFILHSSIVQDTIPDESTSEELTSSLMWSLPSTEINGLWESLIYDTSVKEDTLHFVETAFDFTELGVDPMIVNCNRVVLLHGPPGTGKTSLCKALAHKLSIRLQDRFPRAILLEINSHSLFSKWFSESGKMVFKLFDRIIQMVEDTQMLVCVLIDEVESLTHARKAAMAGLEPSDSLRVVNAMLTQLDRIKNYPNVLVLTTSNVTGAIDIAFVDRADIKRYIGTPSTKATYEILRGCCEELMKRGMIYPQEILFDMAVLEQSRYCECSEHSSGKLLEISQEASQAKLSARALRRLPFLAKALYSHGHPNLTDFLKVLQEALRQQLEDTDAFKNDPDEMKNRE